MWKEFNDHFKNPRRDKGKIINHHDFLDAGFIQRMKEQHSRKTFFSNVGGQSLDRHPAQLEEESVTHEDAVDMGRNRLSQAYKNYSKLQQSKYEVQLNKEKAGIPKWLKQKLKQEGKELKPRVFEYIRKQQEAAMKHAISEDLKKRVDKKKPPRPKQPEVDKVYDQRHIFIIADGQDILAEDLKFTYVAINDRISKFVPDKGWKSGRAHA